MAALRAGVISIALLLGLGFAVAQQGEDLASPQQERQQEKAQHSDDGRAGTTEPSSHTPTAPPDESWVFWNGKLIIPGAPADSETVPAKFSARNNALDELPTMAFPLPLTDEQRQRIRDAVMKAPVENAADVHSADALPIGVEVRPLPGPVTEQIPAVRNLGYVRVSDRVLIVTPSSRIVVGEIAAPGAKQ